MKTAMEIAKMTKAAQKNMETERYNRTMDCIENALSQGVEKAAMAGEVDYSIRVSQDLDRDLIRDVFTSHGFDVRIKGFEVKISWFIQCVKVAI